MLAAAAAIGGEQPSGSRTGRRSRPTRCWSGRARGRRSWRRRASSTSCGTPGPGAPLPALRGPSRALGADRALLGVRERIGPEGVVEPLDLGSLPSSTPRRSQSACCSPSGIRAMSAPWPQRSPAAALGTRRRLARGLARVPGVRAGLDDGGGCLLRPAARQLPARARRRCAEAGLPEPLVMRSSGGVASLEEAAAHASWALLSGPAGGVVGAARIAELAGFSDAIAFDMGGTSTDVCPHLRRRGASARPSARSEAFRSGFRAWTSTRSAPEAARSPGSTRAGRFRVGPESAGGPGLRATGQAGSSRPSPTRIFSSAGSPDGSPTASSSIAPQPGRPSRGSTPPTCWRS